MSRSGPRELPNRRPRRSSSASAKLATCDCAATCSRPSGLPIPSWSSIGSSFTRRSAPTTCFTSATSTQPKPFGQPACRSQPGGPSAGRASRCSSGGPPAWPTKRLPAPRPPANDGEHVAAIKEVLYFSKRVNQERTGEHSPSDIRRADQVLAPPRRRACPVRRVSSLLQTAGGAAGDVFRACLRKRPGRPDNLRPLERLLRGPDREEAPEPLPARDADPVLRDGGVQSLLQVLSELGHQQVPRSGHPGRRRLARDDRPGGPTTRLPQRRLHLQRPGDLHGVRD